VEEPEEPAANRQARRDVQPEAVRPRVAEVHRNRGREQREPDQQRHHNRPVASAREQVGDEEPRARRDDEHEQREPEHAESDERRDDDGQVEEEHGDAEALNGDSLSDASQPNQSSSAPSSTTNDATELRASSPAVTRCPRPRTPSASTVTARNTSNAQPASPADPCWSAWAFSSEPTAPMIVSPPR
jgi:hypothetical protein